MPPMSETMDVLGTQLAKKTNFSIDAIMSTAAANIKREADEDGEEEEEEDIDVGKDTAAIVGSTSVKSEPSAERKTKLMKGRSTCPELDSIKCSLENKELWDKFCEFGTEMIITRTGRRMFPTVRVSFSNLDMEPGVKYLVLLDIVPCDNKRYRYAYHRSAWLVAGKADPPPPHRLYAHPDGPFTPDQLRKQVISFEKVKITNNESDNTGQVILNSMHKFQPRVYLVKRREGETNPVTDIESEFFRTFVFPETQFTAVTAYQNQLITKLKIESNPFAKGFRDTSSSEYEDSHYTSMPSLPGGMPGIDPFCRIAPQLGLPQEANNNNNLLMAAEKARMLMMMPNSPLIPASVPSSSASTLSFPLSPELLVRYSAMQASMGLYNPAILAAALQQTSAAAGGGPLRSPETSTTVRRFAPYPPTKPPSPTESGRTSVSPPASPHPALGRPPFPIFR